MAESRRTLPKPARPSRTCADGSGSEEDSALPSRGGRSGAFGRGRMPPPPLPPAGLCEVSGNSTSSSAVPGRRKYHNDGRIAPVDEDRIPSRQAHGHGPPPPPPTRNPLGPPLPKGPTRGAPPPLHPPRRVAFDQDSASPPPPPPPPPASRSSHDPSKNDRVSAGTSGEAAASSGSKENSQTHTLPARSPAVRTEGFGSAPPPEEGEDVGFWGRLAQGARSAMGLVNDFVQSINAETDSEPDDAVEEAPAKVGTTSSSGALAQTQSSNVAEKLDTLTQKKGSSSPPASQSQSQQNSADACQDDEAYIEQLTQFCVYFGVDLATDSELITEVDSFLKRSLPEPWIIHQTDQTCEYGAGYTYYINRETGLTQWTRPDEEDLLSTLNQKMKGKPLAGSRLFFASLREKTRRARRAALEEQVGHLPDKRPLLRALPVGASEPKLGSSADDGVVHVLLRDQFPILHAVAVEAFSAYFGLGALMRCGNIELRHVWIMKIAALCPVPAGYEFRFDESSLAAAFVEVIVGRASTRHPLDAFFAGLLERMLLRHRSFEAMESQLSGKQVNIGEQVAFFVDGKDGSPYWLRFDSSGPLKGYVSAPVPTQVAPDMGGSRPSSPAPSRQRSSSPVNPPAPLSQPRARALAPPLTAEGGLPHIATLDDTIGTLGTLSTNNDSDDDGKEDSGGDSDDSAISFSNSTLTTITAATGRTELSALRDGASETFAAEEAWRASQQALQQIPKSNRPPPPLQKKSAPPPQAATEQSVLARNDPPQLLVKAGGPRLPPPPPARSTPPPPPPPPKPPISTAEQSTLPTSETPDRAKVQSDSQLTSSLPEPTHEDIAVSQMSHLPPVPMDARKEEGVATSLVTQEPATLSSPRDLSQDPPEELHQSPRMPADQDVEFDLSPVAVHAQDIEEIVAAFGDDDSNPTVNSAHHMEVPPFQMAVPVLPSSTAQDEVQSSQWAVQDGKWSLAGPKEVESAEMDLVPSSELASRADPLVSLAERLRCTPEEDVGAIMEVLTALEQIPITVEQLRATQLGIVTQAYKDHPDKSLRALARRLRRNWKDVVHLAGNIDEDASTMTKDAETDPNFTPKLVPEIQHNMAPPSPGPVGITAQQLQSSPPVPAPVGAALPQRPTLRGRAVSPAVKKKRAEVAANLQWLCRLYLETREQIFSLHEGMPTENLVCSGLREELDVVNFKHSLEEALSVASGGRPPRRLIRKLRAVGRRALHSRSCNSFGRQVYDRFVACCSGHGDSSAFVNGAVPRALQLITRIVEDDRRAIDANSEMPGTNADDEEADSQDPWEDSAGEDTEPAVGESPFQYIDTDVGQPEEEGGTNMKDVTFSSSLQLPAGDRMAHSASMLADEGSITPRGRKPQREVLSLSNVAQDRIQAKSAIAGTEPNTSDPLWEDGPRRVPAHKPFISGDRSMLAKVAKSPLSNVDGLISALVPGAELAAEGVLHQLADDELVAFAYVLEQVTEAASKRLVKELEVRDELKSTCVHRREYLQLLDGAFGFGD